MPGLGNISRVQVSPVPLPRLKVTLGALLCVIPDMLYAMSLGARRPLARGPALQPEEGREQEQEQAGRGAGEGGPRPAGQAGQGHRRAALPAWVQAQGGSVCLKGQERKVTFPEDGLHLGVPVEDVDDDGGRGPDRRLARVLAAVPRLDVVHGEGGQVPALRVPLQEGHRRGLTPVKLQDLGARASVVAPHCTALHCTAPCSPAAR
jgi:hypothetical protein